MQDVCTVRVLHNDGSVTACGLPSVSATKHVCSSHLRRVYRHGESVLTEVGPPIRKHGEKKKKCFCGKPAHGNGYCSTHYQRLSRTGTTNRKHMTNVGKTCLGYEKECSNAAKRRGYCPSCYFKARNNLKKAKACLSA